jgi:outer membrane protein OmpA-like peptidoglycan-associated protein
MKIFTTLLILTLAAFQTQAQFLKKLKQKAEQAVNKTIGQPSENKQSGPNENNPTPAPAENSKPTEVKASTGTPDLKVYSKFDFVPGKKIVYFDNFAQDNIGETPNGWVTSSMAELVKLDGLEGNWLKLNARGSVQLTRNKVQSWGNNFTVEFDLLLVDNGQSHDYWIMLLNTGGNIVSDEKNLDLTGAHCISFSNLTSNGGKGCRTALYRDENKTSSGTKLSSVFSDNLPYTNTVPVHISMCVQGKRFRMWWNTRKLYDMNAVDEAYLPNQLAFGFHVNDQSDYYLSNIRIAKEVPDTRAEFAQGKLISNLLFYTGTANLKPESMGAILDVSKVIKDATSPVKIVGHTDSDGDDASNLKLSQQRAETVKDILIKEYGIDESKLSTEGRGETQPVAGNNSAEGKAQNRRVEFIFNAAADKYEKPAGVVATSGNTAKEPAKTPAAKSTGSTAAGTNGLNLQSKILNVSLPYAQIMKEDNGYALVATKEEGNSKENFLKIHFKPVGENLKTDSYYFDEVNKKKPMYGTKKYPAVTKTEAMLYYGSAQKPYIKSFSPYITDGHMSKFVDVALARHLPAPSENCKLVIEKITDGKASGYFVMGNAIEGLKPVKIGDAEQETFTDGFAGEMKGTFTDIPVY